MIKKNSHKQKYSVPASAYCVMDKPRQNGFFRPARRPVPGACLSPLHAPSRRASNLDRISMESPPLRLPRAQEIQRSWRRLDMPSLFSAILYPALGVLGFAGAAIAGLAFEGLTLAWWYFPLSLAAASLSIFVCNQGIGPLHRIIQHNAGELRAPAKLMVAINCVIAMQGKVKDWVNYHAQHHRHSDQPGDPHNPAEGKFWAWIGWLLWRDPDDMNRPLARRLRRSGIVRFFDRHYISMSLIAHLVAPALIYLAVALLGGSLLLTLMLHSAAVIGRALQFHATTLGVNVIGHVNAPAWLVWLLAFLTGGEAFHAHHHDYPRSVLHRPRRGVVNRLVDYNGTMLLLLAKLRLARNLEFAPEFVTPRRG